MTTPTREGIVPCGTGSHAGRERGWGFCGERGQKLGSRWICQPSQEVVSFLPSESPPPPLKFFFRQGREGAEGASFFLRLGYIGGVEW